MKEYHSVEHMPSFASTTFVFDDHWGVEVRAEALLRALRYTAIHSLSTIHLAYSNFGCRYFRIFANPGVRRHVEAAYRAGQRATFAPCELIDSLPRGSR